MRVFAKYTGNWSTLTLPKRCYVLGKYSLAPVVLIYALAHITSTASFSWAGVIPLLLFMTGFLCWVVPKLWKFSSTRIGVIPFIALHVLLLPVCAAIAKQIVGVVIRLPPQSFDSTVACLAVLFIPIVWALLAGLMFLLAGSFAIVLTSFGAQIFHFFNIFVPSSAAERWAEVQRKCRAWVSEFADHAFGAIALGAFLSIFVAAYGTVVTSPQLVRLVAYALDFSSADDYPGIEKQQRSRLLDNGYVAYAHRDSLQVHFKVAKLDAESGCSNTTPDEIAQSRGPSKATNTGSTAHGDLGAK
ncbi:hypothetical protein [Paraburkholderia bannensis]|uniref:hypothetical protein n=1 Tax=Paraburkholderia bannensis TaxID=765414 RepID=UPI002AB02C38|nr:hypothetical protein [Paraburkholderia bannensis]